MFNGAAQVITGVTIVLVTLTAADVVVRPAASRARAESACTPAGTVAVFQLMK